jgi:septal ring factor EnvC (AmiA/AmiB activator)
MTTISRAFPLLTDLDDDEALQFFAEIQDAISAVDPHRDAVRIDSIVYSWKQRAEEKATERDRKRRNELHDRVAELEKKLADATEAYERLDQRNEDLKARIRDAGDQMNALRYTVRRAVKSLTMIEPSELIAPLGGDLYKEGL